MNETTRGELIILAVAIYFIIAIILDARLARRRARRRGEKTTADIAHEQAVIRRTMLDDVAKKSRMKRDCNRISDYYLKEATEKNIHSLDLVCRIIADRFHAQIPLEFYPGWDNIIPFAECDRENFKRYVSRYPNKRQYVAISYLIFLTNEKICEFFGDRIIHQRTFEEQQDLFWRIHRLEAYYVPKVQSFYYDVRRHRNHPCRIYFPKIAEMYRETKDGMWYAYNTMSGSFGPDRLTGFALEQIISEQNRRWMYFLDLLILKISAYKNISYKAALEELEQYFAD